MTQQPLIENEISSDPATKSKRTGLIITFAIVLALLALLAWGLKKAQAGPVQSGMAPDFTLKSIGLKEISLRDYRGKNVVLLFYPLDWTPG